MARLSQVLPPHTGLRQLRPPDQVAAVGHRELARAQFVAAVLALEAGGVKQQSLHHELLGEVDLACQMSA